MKRRYNSAQALRNIELLREAFPTAQFTTDLMVGFPGETEEEVLDTCEIVRRAALLDAHVFAYSKREGTEAALMDGQIPDEVKKERSARLIAAKNRMRDEVLSGIVSSGKILSCILEGEAHGEFTAHSDTYVEVRVKSENGASGDSVLVKPIKHKNGVIYGEIIT